MKTYNEHSLQYNSNSDVKLDIWSMFLKRIVANILTILKKCSPTISESIMIICPPDEFLKFTAVLKVPDVAVIILWYSYNLLK